MRSCLVLLGSVAFVAACTPPEDSQPAISADTAPAATAVVPPPPPDTSALAQLRDSAGHDLGVLTLRDDTAGILLTGMLRGVPPGTHALHLHTVGQCEPPFTSAGGHWNPTNRKHGTENAEGPHLGDIGNVEVGRDSTVNIRRSTPGGTLRGANGLLDVDGAAVVLHAKADDNKTDPAGDAGARIACGVVQSGTQP